MKNFFAFKDVAYAAVKAGATDVATNPNALADGALGIYMEKPDGSGITLITLDGTTGVAVGDVADVTRFYIARGTAKSSLLSPDILRGGARWSALEAIPAVAKVMTLGGANSSLVNGDVALPSRSVCEVNVVDTTDRQKLHWDSKTYGYATKVANESSLVIAQGLAAEINADVDAFVTAAASGTATAGVLTLTHKVAGRTFDIIGLSACEFAPKAVTTPAKIAIGSYELVRAAEIEAEAYSGRTDYVKAENQPSGPLVQTVVGTSYDTYRLEYVDVRPRQGIDPLPANRKTISIAVPDVAVTESNTQDGLETIIAALLDLTKKPVESGADTAKG